MTPEEDALTQQIKTALQHLATLTQRAQAAVEDRALTNDVLAELGEALEELQVAQEEARAQADELYAQTVQLDRGRHDLETEQQRYQDLFEFAPDGYLVTDAEGVIQEANVTAAALLGVRAEYLKGLPLAVFVPVDGKDVLYAQLKRLRETGGTLVDWELPLQPRGGATFPASVTVGGARPRAGQPAGLRWLLRDISARKRTEADLRIRTEQLRQLTGELALAEERERQRLALVLHEDLQQLLVGVRLTLDPLVEAEDRKVRETSRKARDLVARCLVCSHNLTEELSPPVLHRGGLLPPLQWLVRWMAETHHFTVHLESTALSEDNGTSPEATVLLFRAVRELLLNAVKYAQVDTARVIVTRHGGGVQLVVTDAGVGFDPAQLRLMGGTAGGTGLLGIRERLEYLGGSVKIESAPGHGSCFTIELPTDSAGSPPRFG